MFLIGNNSSLAIHTNFLSSQENKLTAPRKTTMQIYVTNHYLKMKCKCYGWGKDKVPSVSCGTGRGFSSAFAQP